jgi:hypothetical protein
MVMKDWVMAFPGVVVLAPGCERGWLGTGNRERGLELGMFTCEDEREGDAGAGNGFGEGVCHVCGSRKRIVRSIECVGTSIEMSK